MPGRIRAHLSFFQPGFPNDQFYDNGSGIREPTCEGCGVCCMFVGFPPFDTREEIEGLPSGLAKELTDYIDSQDSGKFLSREAARQPCLWLDVKTRKCKHYEHRPSTCVDYKIGNEQCRMLRMKFGID